MTRNPAGAKTKREAEALRMARVLAFIVRYLIDHGYGPTQREIRDGCGIKSCSSVFRDVKRLRQAGILTQERGLPRTIQMKGV
jgi:SOS-response transcriptional repressor LexA